MKANVWQMSGRCQADVMQISGSFYEDVIKMSGRFQAAVKQISGGFQQLSESTTNCYQPPITCLPCLASLSGEQPTADQKSESTLQASSEAVRHLSDSNMRL